jgi:hypothetical protein
MNLLKFFLTDEVPNVGLGKFRENKEEFTRRFIEQNFNVNKQYFKPDYSNNIFLL